MWLLQMPMGLRHRSKGKLRAKCKSTTCRVLPAILDPAEGLPEVFDLLCQAISREICHDLSLLDPDSPTVAPKNMIPATPGGKNKF